MRTLNLIIAALLYLSISLGAGWLPGAPEARICAGLALLAAIAWLWVSEALDVSITALLVPLLAALSGLLPLEAALRQFADPVIFLFLGGFALAAALRAQGLDRIIVARLIGHAGQRLGPASRALFWLTALLSMWISNTATAAMMLPLAGGLLAGLPAARHPREHIYVLLGIAFSANIGGLGTLVGSPPNAIAAAQVGLDFADWLIWGLPLALLLMPAMEFALRWVLRPELDKDIIAPDLQAQAWGKPQSLTLAVFGLTVLLWMFGAPLAEGLGLDFGRALDAAVALLAVVLLHALKLCSWRELEKGTEWGVLLLFGGGLTLSKVLADSGTLGWIAGQFGAPLAMLPALLCLALMIVFAMLITEVTSNTASAALLVPLFIGLAPHLDAGPVAVLVAVGCSCAFLLPVATPPNALAYGTGRIPQRQMIVCGLALSALALPILVAAGAIALYIH